MVVVDYAIIACLVFLESLSHLSSIPPYGSLLGRGMDVPHLNFKSSIEEVAICMWLWVFYYIVLQFFMSLSQFQPIFTSFVNNFTCLMLPF